MVKFENEGISLGETLDNYTGLDSERGYTKLNSTRGGETKLQEC